MDKIVLIKCQYQRILRIQFFLINLPTNKIIIKLLIDKSINKLSVN